MSFYGTWNDAYESGGDWNNQEWVERVRLLNSQCIRLHPTPICSPTMHIWCSDAKGLPIIQFSAPKSMA